MFFFVLQWHSAYTQYTLLVLSDTCNSAIIAIVHNLWESELAD